MYLQNKTYNKSTPTQATLEPRIFSRMNKRKRRGQILHAKNEITGLDVEINDEIAMIQAEAELWILHGNERIVVNVHYHTNLN
jgi:hypothetical protein